MNEKLAGLIAKADAALKGKPAWGKTLCVNFGADGVLYVYANNYIAPISNANVAADCTLTLSMDALHKLMDGEETAMGEWWGGELKYSGDRSVAQQFAALITGKST